MRGRPKKYKKAKRILLFIDEEVLREFDLIYSNRSDKINKMMREVLLLPSKK